MPINIDDPVAEALTRKFAKLVGVGIADAIIIAMREAIERCRDAETPLQTAARLRTKYGVTLSECTKAPLPKEVFDKMWGDTQQLVIHAQALTWTYTADKPDLSVDAFQANPRAESGE